MSSHECYKVFEEQRHLVDLTVFNIIHDVTCASMPTADIYLGLMMNEDQIEIAEESSQPAEVDYMDELLAD